VTEHAQALARHRMERAASTLAQARLLSESQAWDGAVNRYYYSAFHAARALLATRGLDSGKHSGVIALFNLHFVKTGIIQPAVGRALVRAFEKRQASDSADFADVSEEDARRVGEDTEACVRACRAALEAQDRDPSS
jgi:uncharacterized protein (UPF0332 family)